MRRWILLAAAIAALAAGPSTRTQGSVQTWEIFGQVHGPAGALSARIAVIGPMTVVSAGGPTGLWSARWLLEGTYRVTPSQPGYVFSPAFRDVAVGQLPGSPMGVDFWAVEDPGGGPGEEDRLIPRKLTIRWAHAEQVGPARVKLKATLVQGAGHAVEPEEGLTLELDGLPVLEIPPGGLEPKGPSGLKFTSRSESARVKVKLTATGARLTVKMRGLAEVAEHPLARVVCGSFDASAGL